jgi:thiosulfate/3-mercaptopyruvate sulfurtransferase
MAQDDSVVSAQWLHEHLGQPDVKVLDASWYMPVEKRDPWQEYQVAHIPGALFFDIDGIVDLTTDVRCFKIHLSFSFHLLFETLS